MAREIQFGSREIQFNSRGYLYWRQYKTASPSSINQFLGADDAAIWAREVVSLVKPAVATRASCCASLAWAFTSFSSTRSCRWKRESKASSCASELIAAGDGGSVTWRVKSRTRWGVWVSTWRPSVGTQRFCGTYCRVNSILVRGFSRCTTGSKSQ